MPPGPRGLCHETLDRGSAAAADALQSLADLAALLLSPELARGWFQRAASASSPYPPGGRARYAAYQLWLDPDRPHAASWGRVAARSADPEFRRLAARALGEDGRETWRALVCGDGVSAEIRAEALDWLMADNPADHGRALIDTVPEGRLPALLARVREELGLGPVRALLRLTASQSRPGRQAIILGAIRRDGGADVVSVLAAALSGPSVVAAAAAEQLGELGDPAAEAPLVARLPQPAAPEVSIAVLHALGLVGGTRAIPAVQLALDDLAVTVEVGDAARHALAMIRANLGDVGMGGLTLADGGAVGGMSAAVDGQGGSLSPTGAWVPQPEARSMTLHDAIYETIDLEDGVLVLTWKAATSGMAQQDVFDGMVRFGDLAIEHGATSLMVDVRAFGFRPGPTMGTFRNREIIPRYTKAGVRRFAFIFPPGAAPAGPMDDGASYLSQNFDDGAAARAWARES